MASVVALALLVAAAYVVVLAGGIAFEITGLDREMARFHALSAFTGTGFTTKAAEAVVEHGTRRRIAMVLIVLGYAGAASVIATLMSSFRFDSYRHSLTKIALAVVLGVVILLLLRYLTEPLLRLLRRILRRRLGNDAVPQENLFRAGPELGVARIEIPVGCPLAGRALSELSLPEANLSVLMIEHRDRELEPAGAATRFEVGEHVLVFGRLDRIQETFGPPRQAT